MIGKKIGTMANPHGFAFGVKTVPIQAYLVEYAISIIEKQGR